jgi:hypothetical protein
MTQPVWPGIGGYGSVSLKREGGEMQPQNESSESTTARTRSAAGEVAGTAKDQSQQVLRETGSQARQVAQQTRQRMAAEAKNQTERASGSLRQWSDELASMAESSKPDSPVSDAVHQIAETGRRAAEYLDRRGFEGAVGELQDFARRKPGTFLLGAAVAGFLVGRAAKAAQASSQGPDTDYRADTRPDYLREGSTYGQGRPSYEEPEPTYTQEPAYGQERAYGQEPPGYGQGTTPAGTRPYGQQPTSSGPGSFGEPVVPPTSPFPPDPSATGEVR